MSDVSLRRRAAAAPADPIADEVPQLQADEADGDHEEEAVLSGEADHSKDAYDEHGDPEADELETVTVDECVSVHGAILRLAVTSHNRSSESLLYAKPRLQL
jgi:hypothetical protein